LNATASSSSFCDGFEQGYTTGYKKARNTSMDPMTPMCPMQPMKKMSDPDSDYEQGYLIGLQKGLEKGSY
jgi:hypothetical protein